MEAPVANDGDKVWNAATPEEEERYKSIIAERIENSPYYKLIGMEVAGLGPGTATIRLTAGVSHHNVGGIVHGGAIMSVADAAAGVALATLLKPAVERPITIELKLNFCAPVVEGVLMGRGSVVQKGGRIAVCDVEITDESERLIARGMATYMIASAAEV